jgi:sugar phosphate isomerase/epimerase
VLQDWLSDPLGTLEKTKEMGYDGVSLPGDCAGLTGAKLRGKLDELGLDASDVHINFDELCAKTDYFIDLYKEIGCGIIGIPWLDRSRLPGGADYAATAAKIYSLGEKINAAGLTLVYHNHNFEFMKIGGECIFDILFRDVPAELLKPQIDTCWITVGGQDAVEYINKYAGRLPSIHLKDYYAKSGFIGEKLFQLLGSQDDPAVQQTRKDSGFDFRPVGYGLMDFESILKAASDAGTEWLVVEQDTSSERPALEAAKMSADYLRKLGV